jgi:hypothetical protein
MINFCMLLTDKKDFSTQSDKLIAERTTALETRLQQRSLDELLPEVLAILDKIPAREVPEWDRVK